MALDSGPVLLVEQDPENANVVKRAFEDLKVTRPLVHFMDGEDALAYLQQPKEKSPWLILLSLGAYETDGITFLETIKSDESLKPIPVILMASSYRQDIILQSFRFGAVGYMIDTNEPSQLTHTIRTIIRYWSLCAWPPDEK